MYNYLNELAFYKGKSVMIIETSIGVSYGKSSPFLKFKFAPRNDYKSPGQWNDENVFWVTSYVDLCLFVKGIKDVASGNEQKYELKNPSKGVTVSIYSSKNDKDGTEYINFAFYKGETKIHVSLIKSTEFFALYTYYKNLLDNYNIVSQTALLKYDVWYEYVGKKAQGNGSYNNNKKTSYTNDNNNKNQSYTNDNNNYKPSKNNSTMNTAMNSMENDIKSSQNNFDFSDNDVPF